MTGMKSVLIWLAGLIILILLACLIYGAVDTINRGSGFLFIPSFTPSATNTATSTETPTATNTATFTPTLTATATELPTDTITASPTATASPTMTDTPIPTDTVTPLPTFDETAWIEKIYSEITMTAFAGTPSPTPVIPDEDLYTGLRMINPQDRSELFYIKDTGDSEKTGYWIDWNEVSNARYAACVNDGFCLEPSAGSESYNDAIFDEAMQFYPVVNISRNQAEAYCSWAGMQLMTVSDWEQASQIMMNESPNLGLINDGPSACSSERSDIFGNVWEWTSDNDDSGYGIITGGSWKSAIQDIQNNRFGHLKPKDHAEDIGFRCVRYVK